MSRCIESSAYTDGIILGIYQSLEECEENCDCISFSACYNPYDDTDLPVCPEGCYLDYYEFAPSVCICCNGISECPTYCQDDSGCPFDYKCCEGECAQAVDGWIANGYSSLQECYDSGDPGTPTICDAPACPPPG